MTLAEFSLICTAACLSDGITSQLGLADCLVVDLYLQSDRLEFANCMSSIVG